MGSRSRNYKFNTQLRSMDSGDRANHVAAVYRAQADNRLKRQQNKQHELKQTKQQIVTMYLNGYTVNKIASGLAITRELVREAILEYNNRPIREGELEDGKNYDPANVVSGSGSDSGQVSKILGE